MSPSASSESESGSYAKSKLNSVNRYRGRGQYEYQQVYPIFDETPVVHVAFQTSPDQDNFGFPVILPMLGCTGIFGQENATEDDDDGRRYIYLHGYVSARIMRLSKAGTNDEPSGIPVCVSATLMDGIVLALTPNHHSCNYRSAVAFGHAQVVEDEAERLYAMELITNNLVPERWQHTRYPNKTELRSTGILRVEIHSASAKVRTGSTGEAKEDIADEEMRRNVWAGVVPTRTVYGTPMPAPTNLFPGVPGYMEDWIRERNETSLQYTLDAGAASK